jgi:hypothetical protein
MARSVTFRCVTTPIIALANTTEGASSPGATVNFDPSINIAWTSGTGADQLNTVFADEVSLTAATNYDIDVYDFGGAVDATGTAITNAKLKGIIFNNTTAAGTDATFTFGGQSLGATAFNSFVNGSDTAEYGEVPAQGWWIQTWPDTAGMTVTDSSNHVLRIRNTGASNGTFKIWIMGVNS